MGYCRTLLRSFFDFWATNSTVIGVGYCRVLLNNFVVICQFHFLHAFASLR